MSRAVKSAENSPTVAAFDFDGTLTVSDSVIPFMISVVGPLRFLVLTLRNAGTLLPMLFRRDRNGVKERFAHMVFSGRTSEEVELKGIAHAQHLVSTRMRRDIVRRLRWHQREGHVVVIVSASFGPYLHVVGDLLEVDAVLCTELQVVDGVLTGALVGANCRADQKRIRLEKWLAEAGIGGDTVAYAYGDSSGDIELLMMAETAVRVDRVDLEDVSPQVLTSVSHPVDA